MQKNKMLLVIFFLSLSLFMFIDVNYIQAGCLNKLSGLNRYESCQIPTGNTLTIDAEGCTNNCFQVSNTSGKSLFVPTNTCAEWDEFLVHMPTGITTSSCLVDPTVNINDAFKFT